MFPPTGTEAAGGRGAADADGRARLQRGRAGARPARAGRGATSAAARRNRRITANTPFRLTGPAAGSDLLQDRRRPDRHAGSTAPSATAPAAPPRGARSCPARRTSTATSGPTRRPAAATRYGLTDTASAYGWEKIDPRFDATTAGVRQRAAPVRLHRRDRPVPTRPSTPRKHTAMGRFKHEGANVRVDDDGTVVAYMGDDERFDYLYKFVAKRQVPHGQLGRRPAAQPDAADRGRPVRGPVQRRAAARTTTTSAAAPGSRWCQDGKSTVPGMSVEEVLVFTRLAADAVKATPMDRCEDVEPNPQHRQGVRRLHQQHPARGTAGKPGPDAANPRAGEQGRPRHRDHRAPQPGRRDHVQLEPAAGLRRPGRTPAPTSPAGTARSRRSPARTTSPSTPRATCGSPPTARRAAIGKADGLFRVPLDGRRARPRAAVPGRARTRPRPAAR